MTTSCTYSDIVPCTWKKNEWSKYMKTERTNWPSERLLKTGKQKLNSMQQNNKRTFFNKIYILSWQSPPAIDICNLQAMYHVHFKGVYFPFIVSVPHSSFYRSTDARSILIDKVARTPPDSLYIYICVRLTDEEDLALWFRPAIYSCQLKLSLDK